MTPALAPTETLTRYMDDATHIIRTGQWLDYRPISAKDLQSVRLAVRRVMVELGNRGEVIGPRWMQYLY